MLMRREWGRPICGGGWRGKSAEIGIGNAGHPGVGDERDAGSAFEIDNEFGGARHLVVLVVAHSFRFDDVVVQQLLSLACVFARQ